MSDEKTVIRPNTEKYTAGRSGSGAKTMRTDDAVAQGLDGATLDEVKDVAGKMGNENVDKYDHLNVGQRRMCLGNWIRGAIVRGNKAEEGSGDAAFEKAIKPVRREVEKRAKEAEKAAAAKAKEKEAKAKKAA